MHTNSGIVDSGIAGLHPDQILSRNDLLGTITYWVPDQDDPEVVRVVTVCSDVSPLFDRNQALKNETAGEKFGDLRMVASIPPNLYGLWIKQGLIKDDKSLNKLLNDPDYSKLRTFEGRL
jgi:hypothetical protein